MAPSPTSSTPSPARMHQPPRTMATVLEREVTQASSADSPSPSPSPRQQQQSHRGTLRPGHDSESANAVTTLYRGLNLGASSSGALDLNPPHFHLQDDSIIERRRLSIGTSSSRHGTRGAGTPPSSRSFILERLRRPERSPPSSSGMVRSASGQSSDASVTPTPHTSPRLHCPASASGSASTAATASSSLFLARVATVPAAAPIPPPAAAANMDLAFPAVPSDYLREPEGFGDWSRRLLGALSRRGEAGALACRLLLGANVPASTASALWREANRLALELMDRSVSQEMHYILKGASSAADFAALRHFTVQCLSGGRPVRRQATRIISV